MRKWIRPLLMSLAIAAISWTGPAWAQADSPDLPQAPPVVEPGTIPPEAPEPAPSPSPSPSPAATPSPQTSPSPTPSGGTKNAEPKEKLHTYEIYTGFDGLTAGLGQWESLGYNQYDRFKDGTLVWGFETTNRSTEGVSVLGTVALYKDWEKWLYTYTDMSSSTNSQFFPRFRFDNDFNFKLGKAKNVVLTAGYTDIYYHGIPHDTLLAAGLTIYMNKVTLQYRHGWNTSDPGSIPSQSDLFSIGLGTEGKSHIDLTYTTGAQAYLGNFLVLPQTVRQNAESFRVNFRTWTGPDKGWFIMPQFVDVHHAYEQIGFQAGYFHKF